MTSARRGSGCDERADQAAHHLRAGVVARAAVRLAVDDEGVAGAALDERDAAFGAVAFPDDAAPDERRPVDETEFGEPNTCGRRHAAGADAAVAPDGRRPGRRDDATMRRDGQQRRASLAGDDVRQPDGSQRQRPTAAAPSTSRTIATNRHAPGGRQPWQQPEAAGERADDRAERVGRVGAADLRGRSPRGRGRTAR